MAAGGVETVLVSSGPLGLVYGCGGEFTKLLWKKPLGALRMPRVGAQFPGGTEIGKIPEYTGIVREIRDVFAGSVPKLQQQLLLKAKNDWGNYDRAIECFRQVLDPQLSAKFFLHWFWRMTAQL